MLSVGREVVASWKVSYCDVLRVVLP